LKCKLKGAKPKKHNPVASLALCLTRDFLMNDTPIIQTTCPYCGVGCGISAQVDEQNRQVNINGDTSHPANFGRLCSKGSTLGETVELKGRLLQPKVYGRDSSWAEALDLVAD